MSNVGVRRLAPLLEPRFRIMRKALKWIGIVVGSVLGLVLLAGGVLYVLGGRRVAQTYTAETATLQLRADSATLARGAHLTRIHGCVDCHTQTLGGQVFVDVPPFRATAANLTRGKGGVGSRYTPADWDRAIRHGVKPDGHPVLIMPSAAFHQLSDSDAAALIAYLQTVPPVDNELPPTEIRAPGRIAAMFQDMAMEVRTGRAPVAEMPAIAPTPEYGRYLTSITCAYCHGEDLRGAQPPKPGSPYAPDLAAAGKWEHAAFKQTLRTGVTPQGKKLDAENMPWTMTAAMDDVELDAIHAYLATLAPAAPAAPGS